MVQTHTYTRYKSIHTQHTQHQRLAAHWKARKEGDYYWHAELSYDFAANFLSYFLVSNEFLTEAARLAVTPYVSPPFLHTKCILTCSNQLLLWAHGRRRGV